MGAIFEGVWPRIIFFPSKKIKITNTGKLLKIKHIVLYNFILPLVGNVLRDQNRRDETPGSEFL